MQHCIAYSYELLLERLFSMGVGSNNALKQLTVAQIKEKLKQYGSKITGNKSLLIAR